MQYDATNIDPETINTLMPSINLDFLMPMIITSLVATGLLGLLFIIYIVFSSIRRYRVEKATLSMQQDIHAIRQLLERAEGSQPESTVDTA